jgi:hypothetical protein
LPGGSPNFSNPVLFNNIFRDNWAGTWDSNGNSGIASQGDPSPINLCDLSVADGSGILSPAYSLLSVDNLPYTIPSATNLIGVDPQVVATYHTSVIALPWRGNPNFVGVILLSIDLPPTQMGDYHLLGSSPALNQGTAIWLGIQAPLRDIDNKGLWESLGYYHSNSQRADNNVRPIQERRDIGADERNTVGGNLNANSVEFDVPLTTIPGAAIEVHDIFLPLSISN